MALLLLATALAACQTVTITPRPSAPDTTAPPASPASLPASASPVMSASPAESAPPGESSSPASASSPSPSAPSSPSASAVASPADPLAGFGPIPVGLFRPHPATDPHVRLLPESARAAATDPVAFSLGHCGLYSPIDYDGSFWDPVAYRIVRDGPITERHQVDVINSAAGTLTLLTPFIATLEFPSGLVIGLFRHSGGKAFPMCA
jgi:hypothetical protein